LCGNRPCPLLKRFAIVPKIQTLKDEFFGPSPNVFIGRQGYPSVNIGPLGMIEENRLVDDPASWFGMEYQKVVELRSSLLRSKTRESIFSRSRTVEGIQELALAEKPTDIELKFKGKPVYRVSFSDIVQPMGPSASLKQFRIAENPRIPKGVDYVVSDDIKAAEAGFLLYREGYDVYKITSILSSGIMGLDENRKLVPTRWSITGTDDIIGKQLIDKIKNYPSVNDYLVFESEYLHNHFLILLIPGSWEFENFEAWAPGSYWAHYLKKPEILREYEPFRGRSGYAKLQGGGYYASRLGVLEGLEQLRCQARVVVFREIGEGYNIPLGVWVVRETARNAFKNPPERFDTLAGAMKSVSSRLRLPLSEYLNKSTILRQKKLTDFT
jgi:hypothetical protein